LKIKPCSIAFSVKEYEVLDFTFTNLFICHFTRPTGKVVAVTFGEALTEDTVVVQIEKADFDIRSSYQMINQQFLEHQWPDFTYVNRQEDLGIDGVRRSKLSYYPVKMIETCIGREIGSG